MHWGPERTVVNKHNGNGGERARDVTSLPVRTAPGNHGISGTVVELGAVYSVAVPLH
jgi:hypothetical protein